jgi:hypothetical protein
MMCMAETADVGCGCCVIFFTYDLPGGHGGSHECIVASTEGFEPKYRVKWELISDGR